MEDMKEIEARAEAARAKRRAASERLEQSEADLALAQVEKEEREAEGLEAIANACDALGRKNVSHVETPAGWIVLQKPKAAIWRRFLDSGEYTTTALEKLTRPCIVWPNAAKVDAIFDAVPDTIMRCADKLTDLARGRHDEIAGKS